MALTRNITEKAIVVSEDAVLGRSPVQLFHDGAFRDFILSVEGRRLPDEHQKYLAEAKAAELMRSMLGRTGPKRTSRIDSPLRVFTAMHSCPPHTTGGYTGRAHGLISAVGKAGARIQPHTRPGYLHETTSRKLSDGEVVYTRYRGVAYRHLVSKALRKRGEYQYMVDSISRYRSAMIEFKPDVVHLRSTYLVALPALIAAKQLGLPTVYEVSGLWELVYQGRGQRSLARRTSALETLTMQNVDRIATLTNAMRELIIGRGVAAGKVHRIPNAVDPAMFSAASSLDSEKAPHGRHPIRVGYAGSIVDYEGLDDLLRAIAIVEARHPGLLEAVIVGDGAELPRLKALACDLGVDRVTSFTGRVPADEVASYYAGFDICALPRKRTPATDVVSPLKPFEIMMAGKPMIVSDAPALQEIAGNGMYARVCTASSPESLAKELEHLALRRDQSDAMAQRARQFVLEQHTWGKVGRLMLDILELAAARQPDSEGSV